MQGDTLSQVSIMCTFSNDEWTAGINDRIIDPMLMQTVESV